MNKAIDQIIASLSRTLKNNSIIATGVASPLPMIAILLAQKTKKIKLNKNVSFLPKKLLYRLLEKNDDIKATNNSTSRGTSNTDCL